MDTFTVAFIGHRHIDDLFHIGVRLDAILADLLKTKQYIEFLIGRNGEFDLYAASSISRIKRKIRSDNSSLVLFLPYLTSEYKNNKEYFDQYYDEIEICENSANVHFKAAIGIRNREMIDRADLIICYMTRNSGGAFKTIQYAIKHQKRIINIADIEQVKTL